MLVVANNPQELKLELVQSLFGMRQKIFKRNLQRFTIFD